MIRTTVPAEYSQYKQTLLAEKRKWLDSLAAFCMIYSIMRICLKCKAEVFDRVQFQVQKRANACSITSQKVIWMGRYLLWEIHGHPSAQIREQVSLEQDDRYDLETDFRRICCSFFFFFGYVVLKRRGQIVFTFLFSYTQSLSFRYIYFYINQYKIPVSLT